MDDSNSQFAGHDSGPKGHQKSTDFSIETLLSRNETVVQALSVSSDDSDSLTCVENNFVKKDGNNEAGINPSTIDTISDGNEVVSSSEGPFQQCLTGKKQ